tara:strand:- start:279 stop:503 length:225 start_codon:yes stop_codon:yes gene_type:complete
VDALIVATIWKRMRERRNVDVALGTQQGLYLSLNIVARQEARISTSKAMKFLFHVATKGATANNACLLQQQVVI